MAPNPTSEAREVLPHVVVLMTPRQVAHVLQVKLPRIYELVAGGKLQAVRVGRQLRFRRDDLEAFLKRHLTSL